ncbi:hypothetical protein ABW19_dt0205604 [Dactylella cylindrospora]|nr:hypothetical protein ABW19_dt0205604 [Dactylella cylindrospora]
MATERTAAATSGISKKKSANSRIKVPACTSCHSRKIKCNKSRPCLNCVRYGVPCTSADGDEEEISYPSAPVESSDLQALKDRIAQLENLLTKQSSSTNGGMSATPALSPDTPISSSSRSEPATPSTLSNSEARERTGSCLNTKPNAPPFNVWEITVQPQHQNIWSSVMKDELPPVKFFAKKDALRYLGSYVHAIFLRKRYTRADELMETFNQVYPPDMDETEAPMAPASPATLGLFCALLSGMYPDSFKAFSAYLLVKPTLRLLWSQLSIETLDMLLQETSFLTTTGRLDEGYLVAGTAARVGQALGLHISSSAVYNGMDEVVSEKAKMLWWELYCYDRWYSLATGRPLAIRDKDCNVPYPNFTYKPKSVKMPSWQPEFWKAKIRLAEISGKITSKLQKPTQKDLPSFYASSCRNPFRPPPEHIGAKLNEELNNLAKDLPPNLQDPTAHSPALYFALKFQSTKMMLFRSFLHHQDTTIRQQAQEEVFAAALTVTRLCYEGREPLRQLTCGTISMILLTCAVALASYSRAHKGKESARAIEAKEAFETLRVSLRCMDRTEPSGPLNSLHMKNSEAIRKLQAFLEPSSITPKPSSPTSPQQSCSTSSTVTDSVYSAASTTTPMHLDTSYETNGYTATTSPQSATSMLPPHTGNANSYYSDMNTKALSPQSYYNQPMMNTNDFNFYNPENYNPELEFGHFVDPFSDAFFAELMSMNEQNITPDDWSRLLA